MQMHAQSKTRIAAVLNHRIAIENYRRKINAIFRIDLRNEKRAAKYETQR